MKADSFCNSQKMTFTFSGAYDVSALAVSKALQSLVTIAEATAKENYPDVEFRLSVNALSPGSLNIDITAIAQLAQAVLNPANIQYAKDLVSTIQSVFEIKRFLGGKGPQKVTHTDSVLEITNAAGATLRASSPAGVYLVNLNIDRELSDFFNTAQQSAGVSGISISQPDKEKMTIGREDFASCAVPLGDQLDKCQIEDTDVKPIEWIRHNEILFVRQPDLMGKSQWRFKTDRYFYADIADEEFLEKVRKGESMSSKTRLLADVRIVLPVGKDGTPDQEACRYTVLKVHDIFSADRDIPDTSLI